MITKTPKVLGIDGERKMSKSLNNHIELAATPEETEKRVMGMVTDPQRQRLSDPVLPDTSALSRPRVAAHPLSASASTPG